MKINSLEAYNAHSKLKINKINFNNFTLLVGASGVGKTQILRSLVKLKSIATGSSISGFEWCVEFKIGNDNYNWEGKFESLDYYDDIIIRIPFFEDDEKPNAKISSESISINGKLLIRRNGEDILYKNKRTVKLSLTESVVNLLREENDISIIHQSFNKITLIDPDEGIAFFSRKNNELSDDNLSTIKEIRESSFNLTNKLYLCQEKQKEYFDSIVESYKEIFPFVEGVKLEKLKGDSIPKFFARSYILKVKERGIESWIAQSSMSSGMLKTLMQIAHIHLCPSGTVFLIDEFENGFGVNCINDITDILMNHGNDVQYIITSHHPYIINNIPLDNWKIISRKAGVVDNYIAADFNLHESNHEAFTKLINLDVYIYGADK